MIWLLNIALAARKAAQAAWSFIGRYPLQTALIASLCACAWLWTGKNAALNRADAFKAQIQTERDAYAAAQRDAAIKAMAAIKAQEARYKEQASNADIQYANALDGANTALDRYIAANRVRAQAVGCSSSGTIAASETDDASGSNGPSEAPLLVAVTPDDLRICTVNTERLIAAHEWAKELERSQ